MRRIHCADRAGLSARPGIGRRLAGGAVLALLLTFPAAALAAADANPGNETAAVVSAAPVTLTGLAMDALGRSLEGVEIRLHATAPKSGRLQLFTAQTDRSGRFRIADLTPGPYRVIAVKGGFAVLVGQVNTLFENTLDLVMRPAGQAPGPGMRPEDSAWVLRLPRRDPLEDRDASPVEQIRFEPTGRGEGLALPLTLEVLASRAGNGARGGEPADVGMRAAIGSTFEVGESGFLDLSYTHESEGEPRRSLNREDALSARFTPRGEGDGMPLTLALDAVRGRRDRGLAAADELQVLSEGARLRARWTGNGSEGTLSASLEASMFRGEQRGALDPAYAVDADVDDDSATLVAVELRGQRQWDGDKETAYVVSLSSVQGGIQRDASRGRQLLLVPLVSDLESAMLDALDAQRADLRLENRWISGRLGGAMTSRLRVEHVSGHADALRTSFSFGGRWALPAGLSFDVDGGLGLDTSGEVSPLYIATLAGGSERFGWSLSGRQEVGVAPWRGAEPDAVEPLPLMTDRDGAIRGVAASASWRHGPRWPEVKLLIERFMMEGRLAADLPDDLPWVPVDAAGSGAGLLVDLLLDNPATGTSIGLGWSELEDRGENAVLLSGAERWTWQQVEVRQRLGAGESHGARWQLVLGVERGRTADAPKRSPEASRVALLSQSRISGGVSLAF